MNIYVDMHVTRYHKFLRTSLLIASFVLVFDSGILFPITKQLSQSTTSYLANVSNGGMYAVVPQNEYNTLSAQLSEQQRLLDAREAALRDREIANRTYDTTGSNEYSTYIMSIILFLLTVLIVFNYAMDFMRVRQMNYEQKLG